MAALSGADLEPDSDAGESDRQRLPEPGDGVPVSIDSGTRTTGTVNPGIIYIGDKYQVGVEAIVPINRDSGGNIGVIGQIHLYLDDIFPNSIGRPLIDTSAIVRDH